MKGIMKRAVLAAAVICVFLSGCGTPLAKLTPEEESLIVAYAAGSVAKANQYMEQGLTYPRSEEAAEPDTEEDLSEEPETDKPKENTGGTDGSKDQTAQEQEGPGAQAATLAEALAINPITVEYRGYDLRKNYIVGDYFALNASPQMTYLVLNIGLVNSSPEPVDCNMYAKNLNCGLYINDTFVSNSIPTVLTEDFSTFIGTLDGGATMETVIIFEVPEDIAGQIQSLSMDLESDGTVYHVILG